MSERKVLNKYYPPDFDPSKIPRVKCPKNRQFTVRLMAPFNMRCKTCGEYIYKGKKFNARKEDVEGEDYLGIRIFRFYIKCTRCLQEISFKTDPKNTDYEIEAGATRNFMALKLAEEQAEREEEERKEEEASNPMKVLENRTQQSKHELELLESLEELKDLNKRQQSVDYNALISQVSSREMKEKLLKMQEEEDERMIRRAFGEKRVVEEVIVKESKKKKTEINFTPESSKKSEGSNSQSNFTTEFSSKCESSNTKSNLTPEASNNKDTLETSNPTESSTSGKNDTTATSTLISTNSSKAWNSRSVGSIKSNLSSLVKIKKKDDKGSDKDVNNDKVSDKDVNNDKVSDKDVNNDKSQVKNKPNALSLLNSYSDSDGTESE